MRRPSKRSILIGSGFFAVGFIVAAILCGAFLFWLAKETFIVNQGWVVDRLVSNNTLLAVADKSPTGLPAAIIADTRQNSELAATMFSSLNKQQQAMILRQFVRMNQSATLRADHGPRANAALLARFMVLCSGESANLGVIRVNKNTTLFAAVPDWVLDPGAEPIAPVAVPDSPIQQTPLVLSAELKQWTELHQWVIANHDCIARQDASR